MGRRDAAAEFTETAVQHRGQMHHLMSAQKVWVSTDMVSATLDAAGDVPSFEAVDVPAAGLMGLASPLPPVTLQHPLYLRSDEGVTTFTDPVLVDALGWWMDSGRVHVVMCTRTPRLPNPVYAGGLPTDGGGENHGAHRHRVRDHGVQDPGPRRRGRRLTAGHTHDDPVGVMAGCRVGAHGDSDGVGAAPYGWPVGRPSNGADPAA